MRAFSIAAMELKRFARVRNNIFQVLVLPLLIVLLIGAQAGGGVDPRVGVYTAEETALTSDLIDGLRAIGGMEIFEVGSRDAVVRQVERGQLEAGLIIPDDYSADLQAGVTVDLEFVSTASLGFEGLGGGIDAVVTQQASLVRAAQFAQAAGVGTFDDAFAAAEGWQASLPPVEVTTSLAGEESDYENYGQFDSGSHTQLVLFTFLTTLGGAAAIIQARRLGVARRMLASPASVRDVILGEGLGRFAIAFMQGAVIMLATWALFQVNWGSPLGAVVILIVFSAVAAGAAMLLGALVSNEDQANSLTGLLGLGLAALGGAMIPLAAFKYLSETVWRVAHVTPHAWALEAFEELVGRSGGLADIAGFLAILGAYAVVLFVLATWRLRAVLTH